MLEYNGRQVLGFGADPDPRAEGLRSALSKVLSEVKSFARSLTPREEAILKIGLEASHMEESVAHGDWTRAESHGESVVKLLEGLHG
jgi:hypothetical protein